MKKTILIITMIFCQMSLGSPINIDVDGTDTSGGGEWNVIKCEAPVKSGQKITISVCLTGETNEYDQYETIPCDGDSSDYVTIERSTTVVASADILETVKIPGKLFTVEWVEAGFSLRTKNSAAGELSLISLGSAEVDEEASLELDLPSMKHSLKSVTCHFGSN